MTSSDKTDEIYVMIKIISDKKKMSKTSFKTIIFENKYYKIFVANFVLFQNHRGLCETLQPLLVTSSSCVNILLIGSERVNEEINTF